METVFIEATIDSPSILMDFSNTLLKIEGASYPENSQNFYNPVIEWLNKLDSAAIPKLKCEFFFTYINSSSKKVVFELLQHLEKTQLRGITMGVKWRYEDYDEDMYDVGKEFSDLIKIPFEFIANS